MIFGCITDVHPLNDIKTLKWFIPVTLGLHFFGLGMKLVYYKFFHLWKDISATKKKPQSIPSSSLKRHNFKEKLEKVNENDDEETSLINSIVTETVGLVQTNEREKNLSLEVNKSDDIKSNPQRNAKRLKLHCKN